MSTRVITSPGVQINEVDLSLHVGTPAETKVLVMGYAPKGPTEELLNITSLDDLEQIYGTPTTAAERYFYTSVKNLTNNSNAQITAVRLPYGANLGEGYSNNYTALLYPLKPQIEATWSQVMTANVNPETGVYSNQGAKASTPPVYISDFYTDDNVFAEYYDPENDYEDYTDLPGGSRTIVNTVTGTVSTPVDNKVEYTVTYTEHIAVNYFEKSTIVTVMEPLSLMLDDAQFEAFTSGQLSWAVQWDLDADPYDQTTLSAFAANIGGLVAINTDKSAVDEDYAGYYIGIADNEDANPASPFTQIGGVRSAIAVDETTNVIDFATVNPSRLNFKLESTAGIPGINSISEDLVTNAFAGDIGSTDFNDCLIFGQFRLKTSQYGGDTKLLSYQPMGSYFGSLNSYKVQNNPVGGTPVTFALENKINGSSNRLRVQVVPALSQTTNWNDEDGTPLRKVRVDAGAKKLFSQGVVSKPYNPSDKNVGDTPAKIARVFNFIDNIDYDIDVVIEAGLGTIYTHACIKRSETGAAADLNLYDENYFIDLTPISTSTLELTPEGQNIIDLYNGVANTLVEFATLNRKDHMCVLDPLRSIYVQGPNFKTSYNKSFSFSQHVYWPLKNIYSRGSNVSSYAATYGNWLKVSMGSAVDNVAWMPPSSWVAVTISNSTEQVQPWAAPAGFNRAILYGVLDVASTPTQKQRDLLYKINVNPIAWFPGDGYVIWGQKTLLNKPSAFDRINVRRLFLVLEKLTKQVLKYFVFEPNSNGTRTRIVATLRPLFELAKNTDGVYDYRIICDERNNTPLVIDNNELRVSIYLQPVRTAEFILCDFIATRTGVNLDEITVV